MARGLTGQQLREERLRAGLSIEELARALDASPADVIRWEQGGRMPPEKAEFARFGIYAESAARLLERSGLPECEWVAGRTPPPQPTEAEFDAFAEEHLSHDRSCPVCRARRDLVEARLGSPPPVGGAATSVLARLEGLPGPLRTAAFGAGGALLLNGVAIVAAVGAGVFNRDPAALLAAPGLFALSVISGGVAGSAFYGTKRLRGAGRLGYYASYAVAMTVYLFCLMSGVAWASRLAPFREALGEDAEIFHDPAGWVAMLFAGTLFGVVLGWAARPDRAPAPSRPGWRRWIWAVAVGLGVVSAVLRGTLQRETSSRDASAADDSVTVLRGRVAARPADIPARVALGWALVGRHDYAGGATEFRAALAIDPTAGPAYTGLAAAHLYSGGFAEALVAADSAQLLGDTAIIVPLLRADALRRLGRCPEAVAELEPFVAAHLDWRPPRLSLSRCLRALGRGAEALEVIREAVRLEPLSPPLRGELFEAYLANGALDSARAEAQWQSERWPRDPFSWLAVGKAAFLANAMGEAREGYERAFELRPGLRDSLDRMERDIVRALGPTGRRLR